MEKKKDVCINNPHIEKGNNAWCEWAGGSVQGWREYQEDSHIAALDIATDTHLFCVFDGHGGSSVGKYCEKHFGEELKKNVNFTEGISTPDYKKVQLAIKETCLLMDANLWTVAGLQEIYESHIAEVKGNKEEIDWQKLLDDEDKAGLREKRPDAGCTANICLFHKDHLIVANVGDSRTCVLEDNVALPLSEDHKPALDREAKRVQGSGGVIIHGRVNFKLSLTRAIGDLNFKSQLDKKPEEQVLIAVPDFMEYDIKKDNNKFVMMGCDGIWENDDANDKNINQGKWNIDKMSLENIIKEKIFDRILAKKANADEGTDNMTCIIIKFK